LLLGRCLQKLRNSCAGAIVVYSRTELVFILEHFVASESFAAVREAFSNPYPEKEVPIKTTIGTPPGNNISGGFLSSRMWWTFLSSVVKLFCKFFLTKKK
jgi:hypothetical protein